jgi:hypothetical protein
MIPVREFTEIPMRELTETELDAVCGGLFDFGNTLVQTNTAVNIGVGVLGGSLTQLIGQSNIMAAVI